MQDETEILLHTLGNVQRIMKQKLLSCREEIT